MGALLALGLVGGIVYLIMKRRAAKKLAEMFRENFKKYDKMPQDVVDAGPKA